MNTENLMKRFNSLSSSKIDSKVKDVYNLLLKPEIYYIAYQNIYSNKGAFTKGINENTLDKFDQERVNKLISKLKDKTYKPTPVKRIYIQKSNGKDRPLGLPNGDDKIIQECCRLILESIYENKFSEFSYGYRPNKSCITALGEISTWSGTTWFLEFDIKGCFDNINHKILLNLLRMKIDDEKFISLIKMFLKSGYIGNWKYYNTFSGTPQGSIISPILANIYLNVLDNYIVNNIILKSTNGEKREVNKKYKALADKNYHLQKMKDKYETIIFPEYEQATQEYKAIQTPSLDKIMIECVQLHNKDILYRKEHNTKINSKYGQRCRNRLNKISDNNNISIESLRLLIDYERMNETYNNIIENIKIYKKEQLNTNYSSDESSFSRLRYCRYADDFLLGYIGNIKDAYKIQNDIIKFLKEKLKLDISQEKINIINARKGIVFLGYQISKWNTKNQYITVIDKNGNKFKKNRNKIAIRFQVPESKMISYVKRNKYGNYELNLSEKKTGLVNFDDYEIIKQYNSELRGLANYYCYAYDWKQKVGKVQWLMHYSLLKTLACKYKCSVAQIFKNKIIKVDKNKDWYIQINDKIFKVFKIRDIKTKHPSKDIVDDNDNIPSFQINIRNSAIKKMLNHECEICGKTDNDVKIHLHHKNKIGNVDNITWLEKVHKMRNRKTIALCEQCHIQITSNQKKNTIKNK